MTAASAIFRLRALQSPHHFASRPVVVSVHAEGMAVNLTSAEFVALLNAAELGEAFAQASAADDNTTEENDSYADRVNAPLSQATVEALKRELQSGTYARFNRSRRRSDA